MLGDCLERMSEIEAGSVDLILCDLPYGTTACRWDQVIPFEPLWACYRRVLKPRGAVVLTGSQPFTSMLVMSNREWFKYELIWEKSTATGFLDSRCRPLKAHENIVVFSPAGCSNGSKPPMVYIPQMSPGKAYKGSNNPAKMGLSSSRSMIKQVFTDKTNDPTRYPRSVTRFSKDTGLHPTQKPVALMEYLIRTYTNDGEMVLDNTMGSGTTGVACVNTGRSFIGIERDAGYFDIATKRINKALADRSELLPLG